MLLDTQYTVNKLPGGVVSSLHDGERSAVKSRESNTATESLSFATIRESMLQAFERASEAANAMPTIAAALITNSFLMCLFLSFAVRR